MYLLQFQITVILVLIYIWYKIFQLEDYIDITISGYTKKERKKHAKEQEQKRLLEKNIKRKVITGKHITKDNNTPLTDFIEDKENKNGNEKIYD